MDSIRVITKVRFNDLLCDTTREEGDIFEVSPERYDEIMAYRDDLIQTYDPPADDGKGEEKPKASKTKKTQKRTTASK